MCFLIFLALLTCQLYSGVSLTLALDDNREEKCPFQHTVNLTSQTPFENGSYVYQGILIPPEKQDLYDYNVKFLQAKISVPKHRRGCVCEKRPCMKLCCKEHEYLDNSQNKTRCEKLSQKMKVSTLLPIELASGKYKLVDIFKYFTTQVGLPCREPEALDDEFDEWILQEDGILFIQTDSSYLNTLDYCYSPSLKESTGEYKFIPFSCPIENVIDWKMLLNTYAMAVSVLFLIPTILVYLMLKELRGNLRGKLLISYLLSLTMGYAIIGFINISGMRFDIIMCSLLGFTCYFFFMAAFLWLSVLCYDIWKNFKETNLDINSRKNHKQFILYSMYAWTSAGLLTLFLFFVQISPRVDEIYKPGIGVQMCWLNTEKWSAAIYFYGPNLLILIFNLVTFSHLTLRIYKVRRDMARLTHKEKFFQENAIVILRLFLIMGISWFFDIFSYCLREYEKYDFLFILSDFTNAIQGLLIFTLFVMKPNVLNLLRKRFQKKQIGQPRRSVTTSATNFSKLQSSTSVQAVFTP